MQLGKQPTVVGKGDPDKYLHPYYVFGVEFNESCGTERIGSCPFCGRAKHFYVNATNGKFSCKGGNCSAEGGIPTFLERAYELCKSSVSEESLKNLGTRRNLPIRILNHFGVTVNFANPDEYLIPIYTDYLHDLKRYEIKPGYKMKPIPTRGLQIFNLKDIKDTAKADWPIYICEGEWDAMSLYWLLEKTGTKAIVVGIPGAGTFKNDWANYFSERTVIVVYDNDDAGDKGQLKLEKNLRPVVKSLGYVHFPADLKKGYDISDFIRDQVRDHSGFSECLKKLKALVKDVPRLDVPATEPPDPNKIQDKDIDPKLVPSLSELMADYDDLFDSSDEEIHRVIKVMFATIISIKMDGPDPIWTFIVGPPGCGKTTLLMTTTMSQMTLFQSTLSSTSLISGYQKPNLPDPSIIPKLNEKCLVLKDYTEVFGKPEIERENIIGIMRGAYDGTAERNYGQGVTRHYKSRFSFLAGVTKSIYAHDKTSMGERSLRYTMDTHGLDIDKRQSAAMNLSIFGSPKMEALKQRVAYYLSQKFDFTPDKLIKLKPDWFDRRLKALAQLVAIVRTGVMRFDNFERHAGDPIYDPESEDPNRLTVQLQKLALSLAVLEGTDKITDDQYKLVKRVGIDTMFGQKFAILKTVLKSPRAMKAVDLTEKIKVSKDGIQKYIDDLVLLKLVVPIQKPGGVAYSVPDHIRYLWSQSCLG